MKHFIPEIAKTIFENHKDNYQNICLVFPSHRAGIYFKNEFSKLIDKPVWSPAVLSITDFTTKYSDYIIPDNITLLFELYDSYIKYFKDETFDSYYTFGELILKDFDIIDKFNVDANLLFKQIKDEKEIESTFPLEAKDYLKEFWGSILKGAGENEFKDKFLNIWDNLKHIYNDFNLSLSNKKIAYEGKALKNIADNISTINFEYEKIYFAGFNSLNKCEEKIFGYLSEKGAAEIIFDSDKYYFDDVNNEAGKFIRRNLKTISNSKNHLTDSLNLDSKNINVFGTVLNSGEAKLFGKTLCDFMKSSDYKADRTLVVLPDESMLIPVLYSLPDELKGINVTMGLPFKATPLNDLLKIIRNLHKNKIIENSKIKFYHNDIIKILLHPYIKFISVKNTFDFINEIQSGNIIYSDIQSSFIDLIESKPDKSFFDILFSSPSNTNELIEYLSYIINFLTERIEKNSSNDNYKLFQIEYFFRFSTILYRLTDIFKERNTEIDMSTFWSFLTDLLSNSNCNFTGEPLKGIQIMGLLETRNLDFDNVFILSMNEGIMPAGDTQNSYIPYSLKKAFGIPTFEDSDAINSYYFYNLIQKAKNIFLFYNTEIGERGKEKSRYILQIENELINKNKNINYNNKIFTFSNASLKETPIIVEKNEVTLSLIKQSVKRLSATDISNYINCKLQFYLSKVLGLEKEKEVEELFSVSTFGTLFHSLMQEILYPYKEKKITVKDLKDIKENLDKNYDVVFEKVLNSTRDQKEIDFNQKGRNTLYKSVIKRLAIQLLTSEEERLGFTIENLEKTVLITKKIDDIEIELKGKIDRIDSADDIKIIIDYKTGDAKLKIFKEGDTSFFDEIFTNPDYKSSFQTIFYGYLLKIESKDKNIKIMSGVYALKEAKKKGLQFVKDVEFNDSDWNTFEERLNDKIKEIFYGTDNIIQTEKEENCKYCDFKNMCGR